MLLHALSGGDLRSYVISLLLSLPIALLALSLHETAHGFAAWKLGDPTARSLGRLTLNPLKHLNPIGTLCMILAGFGWANPVPINSRYFKKPRRDMALTALAGPISNFLLSFFAAFLYVLLVVLLGRIPSLAVAPRTVVLFAQYTVQFVYILHFVNLTLGLFNCIPVPPLDGSRFLLPLLPRRAHFFVIRYERYFSLALLLLLVFGVVNGILLAASNALSSGMLSLFYLIFGLS